MGLGGLWDLWQLGATTVGHTVFGGWLGSRQGPQEVRCSCVFEQLPGIDHAVLDVLKGQLDRCGPERLRDTCPEVHCPECLQHFGLSVGLALGFASGVLVVFAFGFLHQRPRAIIQDKENGGDHFVKANTPAGLRRLKYGESHAGYPPPAGGN